MVPYMNAMVELAKTEYRFTTSWMLQDKWRIINNLPLSSSLSLLLMTLTMHPTQFLSGVSSSSSSLAKILAYVDASGH